MTHVGSLQGPTSASTGQVCEYWVSKPERENCKFCSVGLNLGVDDADTKSWTRCWSRPRGAPRIQDHVRGLQHRPLRGHLPRHPRAVHPEGQEGDPPPHRIQTPRTRSEALHALRRWASTGLFLLRDLDPQRFVDVCPGKHRQYASRGTRAVEYWREPRPLEGRLRAWSPTARSSQAWRSGGLDRAIDWITSVGAIPRLRLQAPEGDRLRGRPRRRRGMIPVFRRLYEACMERDLPIGVARTSRQPRAPPGGVPLADRPAAEVLAQGDEAEGDVEALRLVVPAPGRACARAPRGGAPLAD